jgi:hypothetical protein
MEDKSVEAFRRFAAGCPYRMEPPPQRVRAGTMIGLATPQMLARCTLRPPVQWPEGSSVLRWLWRGGSPLVFGYCRQQCPLGVRWCRDCGHREDAHTSAFGSTCCTVVSKDHRCPCHVFHP